MKRFFMMCAVLLFAFGCGNDSGESKNSGGAEGGSEMAESCFSSQECLDS
jgi:hypothetical protein